MRILNRIMGFDHQLALTDRQREYSKLIQASSKSLLSLIGGVHDLKKIARGKVGALPFKLNVLAKSPECGPAARRAIDNDACTYKVLVAEDHQINVTLILAVLDVAGCETELAENGLQVLAKLEQADFDLIIMDSQMPMLDGLEATKRIRSRSDWKSLIPILSLTADASEGAEERVLSAGANVYMTKPFNFDCLIASVKSLAWRGRALCRDPVMEGVVNRAKEMVAPPLSVLPRHAGA
ncbi:MAG TPA: response regulator [Geobacterales bacterium]|nr:response regulator [Geobacterales bacterium]